MALPDTMSLDTFVPTPAASLPKPSPGPAPIPTKIHRPEKPNQRPRAKIATTNKLWGLDDGEPSLTFKEVMDSLVHEKDQEMLFSGTMLLFSLVKLNGGGPLPEGVQLFDFFQNIVLPMLIEKGI